ncbi:hypothetical protein ACA910_012635 [Epithemia clementina (nom. ined.)]
MGALWEIQLLDKPGKFNGQAIPTLRELVMALFKMGTNPENPLFHSVDCCNMNGPAKFRFHPNDAAEAHATIAALIPLLCHHLQGIFELTATKLSKQEHKIMDLLLYCFFTPRAVTRSFKTKWDENAGCCISPNEVQMNEVRKANERFHFKCKVDTLALSGRKAKDDDNSNIQWAANTDKAAPPPAQYQQGKSNSISTFCTHPEHAPNATKKHPPRHTSNTTKNPQEHKLHLNNVLTSN